MENQKPIVHKSSALEAKSLVDVGDRNPEFWLEQIKEAMLMLTFHAYRQARSGGIEVDPVHKAINQLGDAVTALQKSGHEVPNIDLSGLPEKFILDMDINPATAKVAQGWRELIRKADLIERYGTREERTHRLKSTSQPNRKLP